jgi:hypothetical protein
LAKRASLWLWSRPQQGVAATQVAASGGHGKRLMDSIRAEMGTFVQTEEDTRAQNDAELRSDMGLLFTIIAGARPASQISTSTGIIIYHRWQERFGKVNEHNRLVPRGHWLEAWEKAAIVNFAREYPLEGYRRLTFMMQDRNIVAVSPASVYRAMREAGLIRSWQKPTRKGTGFVQPLQPHDHWHIDFSYVNAAGTFY